MERARQGKGETTVDGRYRIIRSIAAGGMAQVYEAVAVGAGGFERQVAIKRVLPEHADNESMQRMFLDEARIASRLHHGNIVQVLDYGLVDEQQFLVMEWVDGADLHQATRTGRKCDDPMPEGVALYVFSQIGFALDHAHSQEDAEGQTLGIVHRDVSPQNVILSYTGDVKLSDFGIATAIEKEEKTQTGVVKGKRSYMAPEQASGQRVGPAADVYALGTTMHAALTGAPPRGGATALLVDPMRKFPELDPTIPEAIGGLIRACVAREPSKRPTARAVAEEAGALAAEALKRDGRGALSEWLTRQRPARPSTSNSFDHVMGMWIVAAGADDQDRVFTVTHEAPTPSTDAPTLKEGAPSARDLGGTGSSPDELAPEAPINRRRWAPATFAALFALFALFAIGVGGGSWLFVNEVGPADAEPGSDAAATVLPPRAPDAREPAADAGGLDDASALTEPVRTDAASQEAPPEDERPTMRRRARARRNSAPSAPDLPEQDIDRDPVGLRVGGAALYGCRAHVGGLSRDAPYTFDVLPGRHQVVVRDPGTGQVVHREQVVVTTRDVAVRVSGARLCPAGP